MGRGLSDCIILLHLPKTCEGIWTGGDFRTHWGVGWASYLSCKAASQVHSTGTRFGCLEPQHDSGGEFIVSRTAAGLLLHGQEWADQQLWNISVGQPNSAEWIPAHPQVSPLTCTSTTWMESQHPLIFLDPSPAFLMRMTPANPWSKSQRYTEETPPSK